MDYTITVKKETFLDILDQDTDKKYKITVLNKSVGHYAKELLHATTMGEYKPEEKFLQNLTDKIKARTAAMVYEFVDKNSIKEDTSLFILVDNQTYLHYTDEKGNDLTIPFQNKSQAEYAKSLIHNHYGVGYPLEVKFQKNLTSANMHYVQNKFLQFLKKI